MSRTWLDYYVLGARESARQAGLPCADDIEGMFALAAAGAATKVTGDDVFRDAGARQLLMSSILPFVAPDKLREQLAGDVAPAMLAGRGIQVSRDLLQDLAEAKAPESDLHRELMQDHTWYIDLPHRGLLVGESQQVRAMFIQCPAGKETHGVVILTHPGSDKMTGRYAFLIDHLDRIAGGDIEGVDTPFFWESVCNLMALVLLYRATAADECAVRIPQIGHEDLRRGKPKKLKGRLERASLFRIEHLNPPPDRFGRTGERAGEGVQLAYRVRVRGHFKMQPYGPAATLRKLVWIAKHQRGPDVEKPPLARLE